MREIHPRSPSTSTLAAIAFISLILSKSGIPFHRVIFTPKEDILFQIAASIGWLTDRSVLLPKISENEISLFDWREGMIWKTKILLFSSVWCVMCDVSSVQ